jgi:hypothetical protein
MIKVRSRRSDEVESASVRHPFCQVIDQGYRTGHRVRGPAASSTAHALKKAVLANLARRITVRAVSVPSVVLEFRNKTEETQHRACGLPNLIQQVEQATNASSKKVPKVPTPQPSA